jgi:hypothetical protein
MILARWVTKLILHKARTRTVITTKIMGIVIKKQLSALNFPLGRLTLFQFSDFSIHFFDF